jgi:hypothetical protein
MKSLGTFLIVILLTIANTFLNGWFWMMGYELGIAPLINYLSEAPTIPYMFFVLLCLGCSLIKSKSTNSNETGGVTEGKFWLKYFGIICTDLIILGILWIVNLLVVG